ncbi:hypothetical protein BB560_002857 [Smittium megazygosporum]|uniref:Uncharacterized protein n=1 Tax=Smittium megazygosporum TaxID=133381 RepID=A0A2T9ZDK0_9FUNG|nr:hypothetical protein BB560_002857 [Smittium megazygosporum]
MDSYSTNAAPDSINETTEPDSEPYSVFEIIEPAVDLVNSRVEVVEKSQELLSDALERLEEQLDLYLEWIAPASAEQVSKGNIDSTKTEMLDKIKALESKVLTSSSHNSMADDTTSRTSTTTDSAAREAILSSSNVTEIYKPKSLAYIDHITRISDAQRTKIESSKTKLLSSKNKLQNINTILKEVNTRLDKIALRAKNK